MGETVTEIDTDDLYKWHWIESVYDDDGVLVQRNTQYDFLEDGSVVWKNEDFHQGELAYFTVIDEPWPSDFYRPAPGGQYDWLVKTVDYNALGILPYDKLVTIHYDSPLDPTDGVGAALNDEWLGVSLFKKKGFVDDVLVYKSLHDIAGDSSNAEALNYNSDLKDWRSREWNYDLEGNLESYEVVYDNGVVKTNTWDEDFKFTTFEDGEEDNFDWSFKARIHDEEGNLLVTFKQDDDADVHWSLFQDGERVLRADMDVADNHDWFGRVRVYEDGQVVENLYLDTEEEFLDLVDQPDIGLFL